MAAITYDFSKVPSDVALFLSQNVGTEEVARELARCMRLPEPERQFIEQEIIGAVAEIVDKHLDYVTRPEST